MKGPFLEELKWRGLLVESTPGIEEFLAKEEVRGYIGFDPTADSLHVGSLLQIMSLARLQRAGHTPIPVIGGGTGMIGDPSGKTAERQLQSLEQIAENAKGIRAQLERFLDFSVKDNPAIMVNNADWLRNLNYLEFLRDVGKFFSVNMMVNRDSVRRRLEGQEGISYTEFSYMLLQSYDFLMLYDRHGCRLQMGGTDQWGNIVSGIDLIRRMRGVDAYGLVSPLVTMASGAKFGKTEAGTIWLDAGRTSPYKYYQFWLNTEDKDVIPYLKFFTWLGPNDVADLEKAAAVKPEDREAQRVLAREVTRITHGDDAVQRAEHVSRMFFSGELAELSAAELLDVLDDAPSSELRRGNVDGAGLELSQMLHSAGLASSKGDGKRAIEGGGIYLSGRKISDRDYKVTLADSIEGKLFLLRKGKKQYHVVRILS